MELTRRDVVAALAAAGASGGVVVLSGDGGESVRDESSGSPPTDAQGENSENGGVAGDVIGDHEMATLVALGDVLYPTEVENVDEFVRGYVRGRGADQPEHVAGMTDALAYLDEYTEAWHETQYVDLGADEQDEVLRDMGIPDTDPDPEGSDVERVRFYLVNELQFALYTTPTGGRLLGIENPQGYPGGLQSYQHGP